MELSVSALPYIFVKLVTLVWLNAEHLMISFTCNWKVTL